MKIARLLMVLFALSVTALSAAPVRHGGGSAPSLNKSVGDEWWCNDGHAEGECYGMYDCMDQCMANCGPPCTWYG